MPFAFATEAPAYWRPEFEEQGRGVLGDENCEIDDDFFVRGRIRIPVNDADEDFEWGVWVTLSEANYERMLELWSTLGREAEPAYFGRLVEQREGITLERVRQIALELLHPERG